MSRALGIVVAFIVLAVHPVFVRASTEVRILVDASKDGGAWWFPQFGEFDPELPHQGKCVADYLRSLGYTVTELPRLAYDPITLKPYTPVITLELLREYSLVIRPGQYEVYSGAELNAYYRYVTEGGRLLLLSGYWNTRAADWTPAKFDQVASVFGIRFAGIARGASLLNTLKEHPITDAVFNDRGFLIRYTGGSGIVAAPPNATLIGFLSNNTYIDLNDNEVRDPNESVGAPALGVMEFGRGRVVFCGSILWMMHGCENPNGPEFRLLRNAVHWLLGG